MSSCTWRLGQKVKSASVEPLVHSSHAEQILYTGPAGTFEGAVSGKRLLLLVSAILHTCSSAFVTAHPFVRNGRMDLAMSLFFATRPAEQSRTAGNSDRMLQACLRNCPAERVFVRFNVSGWAATRREDIRDLAASQNFLHIGVDRPSKHELLFEPGATR